MQMARGTNAEAMVTSFSTQTLPPAECHHFCCGNHDQESSSYEVMNLRAGREWGNWSVSAWVRNLFDEDYAVRGFFFGNEPPDFPEKLYERLGDPRHIGVTIRYTLGER